MKNASANKGHTLDVITIVCFTLLITILNWLYLTRNTVPPHYDMGRHLWTSLNYYRDFGISFGGLSSIYANYFYYPPFVYVVTIPWYRLFGTSLSVAVSSNIQWLLMLSLSLYGVGKNIWDRRVGLIASLSVLTVPIIAGHAREYQLDLPLTAIVTLTFYLLIKSDYFLNPIYSLLLGLTVGAGFLVKWTYPAFVILPLAIVAIISLGKAFKEHNFQRVNNMILVLAITLALGSIWYYDNRGILREDFARNGIEAGAKEGDPSGLSDSIPLILNWLFSVQMYLPLAIFAVIGFVLSIIKRSYFLKNWPIVSNIVFITLEFALLGNKDVRYIMPYLPLWVLLATFWLFEVRNATLRKTAVSLFLFVCAINIVLIQIAFPKLNKEISILAKPKNLVVLSNTAYTSYYPEKAYWPITEVISDLSGCHSKDGNIKTLIYGPNYIKFNDWAFMYQNKLFGDPLNFISLSEKDAANAVLVYDDLPNFSKRVNDINLAKILPVNKYTLPDNFLAASYCVNG